MTREFPTLAAVVAMHRWSGGWITDGHYNVMCGCGWLQIITNTHRTGLQLHGDHVESEWREACTISDVEQLKALPVGAVVLSEIEVAYQHDKYDLWHEVGHEVSGDSSSVDLPARLLVHPDWAQS